MLGFFILPFSTRSENLAYNLALHSIHCKFCCVHQPLLVTSTMEVGAADHAWEIGELVALLEA